MRPLSTFAKTAFLGIGASAFIATSASAQFVNYVNETATRLVAISGLVVNDNLEKDFGWGDFDQDGDLDLACMRKFPGSIQGGFRDKLEFERYDVPAAFLQCKLPVPYYGRLPADLTEPYNGAYVKIHRCIYGARISNSIFDKDHSQLLLSQGYVQFEADLRKFKVTCPNDPNTFVIINTHVDDGGAILTWFSKYDETL